MGVAFIVFYILDRHKMTWTQRLYKMIFLLLETRGITPCSEKHTRFGTYTVQLKYSKLLASSLDTCVIKYLINGLYESL